MLEQSGLYYPNRIARWFFVATEEVMGKHGLNTVLSMAGLDAYIDQPPPDNLARQFDFSFLSAFGQGLEDMYGVRGGRGMALRIGRASFARGMKTFGAFSGMADPAFQGLDLDKRVYLGLKALAAVFTNFTDQESTLDDAGDIYRFTAVISPFAWGRTADKPVCHALAGVIQESLRWSSTGYEYHVQEVACRAAGGEQCVFRINKQPMGQLESRSAS